MKLPTILGKLAMPLSGEKMLKLFLKDGWVLLRQKGSHAQIKKGSENETIPMHRELDKGMERKLLKRLIKESKNGIPL